MTLKELSKQWKTPLGNLIKKAQLQGLKVSSNSQLSEAQIELLKATDNTPQLKPAQASEPSGEMEIREDSVPAAP
ncbi:MAG TPA: translation initiation factor IF-2 N-terminal domain-containing protein, partial [Kamptonema sp.]|nr:translation initiation factor IF-2 N-terminal domain-containing protein [Kamptonema sp.]